LRKKTKRRFFLQITKILLGLTLLFFSLRGIEWEQLSIAFKAVQPLKLLGVFVSMLVGLFLKVIRWDILLSKYGLSFPVRRVAVAYFFGQVTNILLPARGGDVVRLGIISAHEPATAPQTAATIALEKFIDLVAFSVTALGVAAYLPSEASQWLHQGLLPLSGFATLGLVLIILFAPLLWSGIEKAITKFHHPWLKRGAEVGGKFIESSLWLRDVSNMLPLLAITLLIWGFMILNSLILFQALSLDLPITAGGLVLVLGYIRSALQLPPGSVGPFYFFAQLGVTTFGVNSEKGLVFAILLHAVVTLTPIFVSLILLLTSQNKPSFVLSKPLAELIRKPYD